VLGPSDYLRSDYQKSRSGVIAKRARLPVLACAMLLLVHALAACSPDTDRRRTVGSATVSAIDSLDLQESDSSYIGRPVGLAVSPRGDLYVIDAFRPRVIRYAPDGSMLREIGRSGQGPGEFSGPTGLAFLNDTTVAVLDLYGNTISLFDTRTGAYRRRRSFDGSYWSLSASRDRVWLGLWNRQRGTAVALWNTREDSISHLVALPPFYADSLTFRGQLLGHTVVVARDTGMLVSYAAQEELLLADARGQPVAHLRVPLRQRRGVPQNIEERWSGARSPAEMYGLSSHPMRLHQLSSGRIVIVHADMELTTASAFLQDIYLTLLSDDLTQACIDAPVSVTRQAQPWFAFATDTLLVLEQVVLDTNRAVSRVRKYTIDDATCEWVPVVWSSVATLR
jgi:hypothetical protein